MNDSRQCHHGNFNTLSILEYDSIAGTSAKIFAILKPFSGPIRHPSITIIPYLQQQQKIWETFFPSFLFRTNPIFPSPLTEKYSKGEKEERKKFICIYENLQSMDSIHQRCLCWLLCNRRYFIGLRRK